MYAIGAEVEDRDGLPISAKLGVGGHVELRDPGTGGFVAAFVVRDRRPRIGDQGSKTAEWYGIRGG